MRATNVLIRGLALAFVTFAICEIGLHLISLPLPPLPETLRTNVLQYEPAIYSRHLFPAELQQLTLTFKGRSFSYHINSLGYRGPEFSIPKSPQTTRIIVYGGSSVFDIRADEGQDWPHLLQSLLHVAGYSDVEVINGGIPGHSLPDCLGRFLYEGQALSADYVAYYGAWNDIKSLTNSASILRERKPYQRRFNPYTDYSGGFDRFLTHNSKMYFSLRSGYVLNKYPLSLEAIQETPNVEFTKLHGAKLLQYKLTLQSYVATALLANAKPVIITEGHLPMVDNADRESSRIAYHAVRLNHSELVGAFDQLVLVGKEIASQYSIPLIDASANISGVPELFDDHVHLTESGSIKLAQIVAQGFIPLLQAQRDKGPHISSHKHSN